MFILKSMRTLALTILLVPMAAQASMPRMRDYVGRGLILGFLSSLSCCYLFAENQENAINTQTLTFASICGLVGSLFGYGSYKKQIGEFESKQNIRRAPTLARISVAPTPTIPAAYAPTYAYDSAIADSKKTIDSIAQETKKRKAQEEKEKKAQELLIVQTYAARLTSNQRNSNFNSLSSHRS